MAIAPRQLPLFHGCTAWFSCSVQQEIQDLWVKNGGEMTTVDLAEMVFSQDASTPDTRRLYNSKAYMMDHLAIFHASYIYTCVKNNDTNTVPIGKFLLPPIELYQKIKGIVDYAYTYTLSHENVAQEVSSDSKGEQIAINDSQKKNVPENFSDNAGSYADYIWIDVLPSVKNQLLDFEPGENNCQVVKR